MKKLLYLKDEDLKQYIEKIFLGYRETVSDAKNVLNKYSIGVAHNKVIHLISLYEGITISELLRKLKVTKQSLNRVLKDLINLKAIKYEKDQVDTRIKHVFLKLLILRRHFLFTIGLFTISRFPIESDTYIYR